MTAAWPRLTFDACPALQKPVGIVIQGESGSGKTTAVEAWCAQRGKALCDKLTYKNWNPRTLFAVEREIKVLRMAPKGQAGLRDSGKGALRHA